MDNGQLMATVLGVGQIGSPALELALGPGQLALPSFDEATIQRSVEAAVDLSHYYNPVAGSYVFELRGVGKRVARAELSYYEFQKLPSSEISQIVADICAALVNELVADLKAEFDAVLAESLSR